MKDLESPVCDGDDVDKTQIGTLKVSAIGTRQFSIPYYQRGYRWKKENVEALLDDLFDFSENLNASVYCLQPLVLKRILGSDRWRIVDGQQRLTTITLIFVALGIPVSWTLFYEKEEKCLGDLLADVNDKTINADFRRAARDAIDKWGREFPEKKTKLVDLLAGKLAKDIVFIEYHVPQDENEQDVFNRLNTGKIPLTSAELIKALYMVECNGLTLQEQIEISKEWEHIERHLRDESFWSMFYSKHYTSYTRIDILFGMVCDVSITELRVDKLAVYNRIERRVRFSDKAHKTQRTKDERKKELVKIWGEVLHRFWWMDTCYSDARVYNFMGWLSLFSQNQPKTLFDLYEKWRVETGDDRERSELEVSLGKFSCFRINLARIICDDMVKALSPDGIEKVAYTGSNQEALRKLFVLLNVQFCNNRNDKLRFDKYKEEEVARDGWDVEHVDAKSVATIDDENGLHNLVLLDAKTNRDYKAAPFSTKREYIRENMRSPNFYVLPCTQCAFMKFFSKNDSNPTVWSAPDGNAYREEMINLFNQFNRFAYGPRDKHTGALCQLKEAINAYE